MKPVQLVLSAFGSYGGTEVVDFEKIKQGLFLITGDTGAGKTTIFDGISYAALRSDKRPAQGRGNDAQPICTGRPGNLCGIYLQ